MLTLLSAMVVYMWTLAISRGPSWFVIGINLLFFTTLYLWLPDVIFYALQFIRGRRVIGISGSLIWSNTLMELIFNPCGEFRWNPEGPFIEIHFPHLKAGAPGIFSDLLRSVQMLKREWGAESYRSYSIPGKTTALVPEFAVEDLPSAELQL